MSSEETLKPLKRMPRGAIKLGFAGDIVLARNKDPRLGGLFKRYEALFETFANMDKPERIVGYKLFNALMLTSYAKKAETTEEKHRLFDMKNEIFLSLANNRDLRKYLALRYLVSSNFRVTEFCPDCSEKNAKSAMKRHEWKHCKNCKIDRDFYNVVAMAHNFRDGFMRIFLSNDLVHRIQFQKTKYNSGKLAEHREEGMFNKYHYNARNLDAIAHSSVLEMYERFAKK